MTVTVRKSTLAKPFLKWAGGKGQLISEIEARLPTELKNGQIDTYAEPFVGGGAIFFHITRNYDNIKHFYLFDINQDLVNCYNTIKNSVEQLIRELKILENEFLSKKNKPAQKEFFYKIRDEFNSDRSSVKLIFLNKTCFNGLYRVNRKDEFNVPFGDYKKPTICDEDKLWSVSNVLQNTEIIQGDFTESARYIDEKTFVYFDPPYRPLSATASFTSYSKDSFTEDDQLKLAMFCREVNKKGAKFILSNSDPKNEDPTDHFFENHYKAFKIDRVKATRAINCKAAGRGQINELIITN